MPLTDAQLPAFKVHITTDPVYAAALAVGDDSGVAALANAEAPGPYWLWKTSIFESEITRTTTAAPDNTVWSWTTFIGRSQGERDAWARLFMGGGSGMDPSLTNVRQGIADIFSGAGGLAQRTHLLAVCRRRASRAEKLYAVAATGPGNDGVAGNRGLTSNPDAPVFQGQVTDSDVARAKALPA